MRLLAAVLMAGGWAAAVPAHAQQILASGPAQHDKARLSGFIWRGKPQGTLDFDQLDEIQGFEDGVDVTEVLGFDKPSNGWILEGNFAPGRKHHVIVELSRLEASGAAAIDFPGIGSIPAFTIDTTSEIALREFHAFYNYLFVARPQVEFGLLAGLGWFDTDAELLASVGSARAGLDQAFPSFGGNLMVNPQGPVRGYVEISGFPRVEIEDLSGWQLDLAARLEVFVVRNFGLIVGYRHYQLVFDHDGQDIALDLTWNGFTFGAQARF
jgi:hypothetical protein